MLVYKRNQTVQSRDQNTIGRKEWKAIKARMAGAWLGEALGDGLPDGLGDASGDPLGDRLMDGSPDALGNGLAAMGSSAVKPFPAKVFKQRQSPSIRSKSRSLASTHPDGSWKGFPFPRQPITMLPCPKSTMQSQHKAEREVRNTGDASANRDHGQGRAR